MTRGCPNFSCTFYHSFEYQKKDGHYFRQDDSRYIQRFKCTICNTKYSASTHTLEYRQKKRRMNRIIRNELASGVSIRRCARNLRLNKTTVARKLIYLAKKARLEQNHFLASIQNGMITHVMLDDLITSVHTKLKPLAISVVIDSKHRLILGAKVSEIPAFGKLAKLSRKKYGRRKNDHPKNLDHLLSKLSRIIHPEAIIRTDEHNIYPVVIKKHLKEALHQTFKSERAAVAGLGELKSKRNDPLFMINHTLAMMRANINRLFRRTWCTSKDELRLQDHVDLFVGYFNEMILEKSELRYR